MGMRKAALLFGLASLGLASYALLRSRSELLARLLRLPPPTNTIAAEYDLPIALPDGVTLYADRFFPREPGDYPTVLVRTPYGRPGEAGLIGQLLRVAYTTIAARGYHVLVQSVRGRFRSGGEFEPFVHEAADGKATMAWIAAQPWFNGSLGMYGASYLGYAQWAAAIDGPPFLKAIVPAITSARFSQLFYPVEGVFTFESSLNWVYLIQATRGPQLSWASLQRLGAARLEAALRPARAHLPISEADELATGGPVSFYRTWLENDRYDAAYWQRVDVHRQLGKVDAPAHLIAGWYDIFLREQLADYAALLAVGRSPFLTIGPQHHAQLTLQVDVLRESLIWFAAQLKGDPSGLRRRPVRLYLMGADEWHEMDYWPPPAQISRYYLQSDQGLHPLAPSAENRQKCFTYYTSEPTPNIGGALLISPQAGPQDQAALEARADLLVYTSAPLERQLDLIGHVRLELYVQPGVEHCDFVGRLCDVYPDGRSYNICDGIVRLGPGVGERQADGSLRIEIDMGATGQRFLAGHRIRLQIASAGHPRWSRNPGTGQSHGPIDPAMAIEQIIFHDKNHPSALVLPIVSAEFLRQSAEFISAGAANESPA
jgi:uncharacterized protein